MLLAASIKVLPYETPDWITNKEAKQLFSPMVDDYAFGEMGEVGKGNIADFAAQVTPRCSFECPSKDGSTSSGRRTASRDRGCSTGELRMPKSRAEVLSGRVEATWCWTRALRHLLRICGEGAPWPRTRGVAEVVATADKGRATTGAIWEAEVLSTCWLASVRNNDGTIALTFRTVTRYALP